MIHGATDDNPLALPARDRTVTKAALGMEFLGPPVPTTPHDTENVVTYYTTRQSPTTAQNQLDYVFASRGFHESISVRALNSVEEWGASDHCRLLIEVAGSAVYSCCSSAIEGSRGRLRRRTLSSWVSETRSRSTEDQAQRGLVAGRSSGGTAPYRHQARPQHHATRHREGQRPHGRARQAAYLRQPQRERRQLPANPVRG